MIVLRQRQAATTIQRAYRIHLAQKELKKLRSEADKKTKAACMIQRYYRCYIGRKKRQNYQRAAIIIQVAPILLRKIKGKKSQTNSLQSRIRGYLARIHYQNMRRNANQNNIPCI
uniref:Myosin motor domain-containing protein n=1 Tax=Setaria digitata TaxID=48799 RepID=A0A915Q4Y4_9BILA